MSKGWRRGQLRQANLLEQALDLIPGGVLHEDGDLDDAMGIAQFLVGQRDGNFVLLDFRTPLER